FRLCRRAGALRCPRFRCAPAPAQPVSRHADDPRHDGRTVSPGPAAPTAAPSAHADREVALLCQPCQVSVHAGVICLFSLCLFQSHFTTETRYTTPAPSSDTSSEPSGATVTPTGRP